jgi:hypothetical protein
VQLWQQISNSGLEGQAAVALQRLLFVVATAVGRQQGSQKAAERAERSAEMAERSAEMAERFADQVREEAAAKVALAEQAVARETHVAALTGELAMKDLALKEGQRATAMKLYMKSMGWLNMRGILGGFPHYDAGMHPSCIRCLSAMRVLTRAYVSAETAEAMIRDKYGTKERRHFQLWEMFFDSADQGNATAVDTLACLKQQTGWTRATAPGELSDLYGELSKCMHRWAVLPNGEAVQVEKDEPTQTQHQALLCICDNFGFPYEVVESIDDADAESD